MSDWKLQDPVITRAMLTGWGYPDNKPEVCFCQRCGELIDDYDLDAYIGFVDTLCGNCVAELTEEEDE